MWDLPSVNRKVHRPALPNCLHSAVTSRTGAGFLMNHSLAVFTCLQYINRRSSHIRRISTNCLLARSRRFLNPAVGHLQRTHVRQPMAGVTTPTHVRLFTLFGRLVLAAALLSTGWLLLAEIKTRPKRPTVSAPGSDCFATAVAAIGCLFTTCILYLSLLRALQAAASLPSPAAGQLASLLLTLAIFSLAEYTENSSRRRSTAQQAGGPSRGVNSAMNHAALAALDHRLVSIIVILFVLARRRPTATATRTAAAAAHETGCGAEVTAVVRCDRRRRRRRPGSRPSCAPYKHHYPDNDR